MEHFRIFDENYEIPQPEPKWRYNVGAFVVCVKDLSESFSLKVRVA